MRGKRLRREAHRHGVQNVLERAQRSGMLLSELFHLVDVLLAYELGRAVLEAVRFPHVRHCRGAYTRTPRLAT